MSFFKQQSAYVSDFSRFLNEMKQRNPQIEADQQAGRARLWDTSKINLDDMRRAQESHVKEKAYVPQGR